MTAQVRIETCIMSICTDSSGKLLYNVALCYLASGNPWLSFPAEQGNPSHRRRRWKVCYRSQMQQEQPCLLLHSHQNAAFQVRDKGFLRTPKHTRSTQGLFLQHVSAQDAPTLRECFPANDKWAFDWIHQQHGIWMKDEEMEGWGGGAIEGGGPVREGSGCWLSEDRETERKRNKENQSEWKTKLLPSLTLWSG